MAMVLALSVTACTRESSVPSLQVGATRQGEITTADRVNYGDGSHSVAYRVALKRGQAVRFEAKGSLCPQLALFRDGRLVAGPGKSDCDNEGGSSTVAYIAPEDGRYELAVGGAGAHAFGPFTVSSTDMKVYQGGKLGADSDITDQFAGSAKDYVLSVQQAGLYTIDMRSEDFDALLKLSGNRVNLEDDDGGEHTDSRISVILQPGDYRLVAGGVGDSHAGMFQITVRRQALPSNAVTAGGQLSLDGREVTGLLSSGSPPQFRFSLPQRRLVSIDMRSSEFDSALELHGPGTSLDDDDGGGGRDARIEAVLQPGDYIVTATKSGGPFGIFTLSARTEEVPENAGGGELRLDEARDATLVSTNTKDRYKLVIGSGGRYVIRASSDDFDTFVALERDGDRIDGDDDGGDGTNSLLRVSLQPGAYEVMVTAADRRSGRYRLRVGRDVDGRYDDRTADAVMPARE